MTLKLGLITAYAKADWHAQRLEAALSQHGEVEVVDPSALRLLCGRAGGRDVLLLLAGSQDVRRFDAVLLGRIAGPHADADVQLDAARALELLGVPCCNRVGPMLAAQDKLWTAALLAAAGVPTPLCSAVPRPSDAIVACAEVGHGVAKPLFGSLGDGMFLADDGKGRRQLQKAVRSGPFLVQRFVPPGGVDYRLFVVGDRVEGCIRREAPEGEWRSNVAKGGRALAQMAPRTWRDVAIAAVRALGLDFAGVDLAVGDDGPMVLEVNGFPNFRGVFRATGRDMAPLVAQRVVRLARQARGRSQAARARAGRGGRKQAATGTWGSRRAGA